jgi:hypothetical protein
LRETHYGIQEGLELFSFKKQWPEQGIMFASVPRRLMIQIEAFLPKEIRLWPIVNAYRLKSNGVGKRSESQRSTKSGGRSAHKALNNLDLMQAPATAE